jgi:hypothetical protein
MAKPSVMCLWVHRFPVKLPRTTGRYLHVNRTEFKLFHSLGSTEASAVIERKVNDISKKISKDLEIKTMFKPVFGSEDVKEYVRLVIAEMKKSSKKTGNANSDDILDKPTK